MAIQKITAAVLGNNAVTAASVAAGTLSAADIADNSITAAKLSTSTFAIDSLTVNTSDLVVDTANNRVGVGTASPNTVLDVVETSTGAVNLANFRTTGGGGQGLWLGVDTTNSYTYIKNNTSSTYGMTFWTNATERMRIDSSGRLLAGTQSVGARSAHTLARTGAFAAEILQQQTSAGASVLGLTYDGAAPNNTTDYFIYARDTAGIKHLVRANGDGYFAGDVGIGTDTPMVALNIHDATTPRLALTNSTTGQTFPSGFELLVSGSDAYISQRQNANLIFSTNNTERVRIESNGNVLLGGGNQMTNSLTWWNISANNSLSQIRNLSSSSYNDSGSLVFTIERTSQGGFTDSMWLNYYGALHIDDVNTDNYSGKSWLNESWDSTARGGSNASSNTYMKNRLWVNGDINLGQGRGVHFGDVTDSAPLSIREGKNPSDAGVDTDELSIWTRRGLSISSSYGKATGSKAGVSATHFQVNMPTGGGTWIESLYTPNGSGAINHRMIEDWSGRWIIVGRFSDRSALQSSWSSVTGLSTGSSATTAFSSDWGDIYPKEVRVFGCTDIDDWFVTRTIDFIYGVPSARQWKHFFAGGTSDGMTYGTGVGRWGFTTAYAYDGFGRWRNPNFASMGMSDGNTTNPISAYTTPTTNAFNWYTAGDAKLLVHSSAAYASQDGIYTAGFGYDDTGSIHADGIWTEYNNTTAGVTSGWDTDCQFFIALKVYGD